MIAAALAQYFNSRQRHMSGAKLQPTVRIVVGLEAPIAAHELVATSGNAEQR